MSSMNMSGHVLQHTATPHCNKQNTALQHTATHCNTQHTWKTSFMSSMNMSGDVVRHTATPHCNKKNTALQHTATHCNTLQHTTQLEDELHVINEHVRRCGATHCNTPLQQTKRRAATHCNTQHTWKTSFISSMNMSGDVMTPDSMFFFTVLLSSVFRVCNSRVRVYNLRFRVYNLRFRV